MNLICYIGQYPIGILASVELKLQLPALLKIFPIL
jgi:hypothetical protein